MPNTFTYVWDLIFEDWIEKEREMELYERSGWSKKKYIDKYSPKLWTQEIKSLILKCQGEGWVTDLINKVKIT